MEYKLFTLVPSISIRVDNSNKQLDVAAIKSYSHTIDYFRLSNLCN